MPQISGSAEATPMRYSPLVERVGGDGADAWDVHYAAQAARDRGEDVLLLSIGDPDLATPVDVIERAVTRLRAGDTHYTPHAGRAELRAAIAAAHAGRTGQQVGPANVLCTSGAQNALFVASLCLAGPGDEVIAFDPLYTTYPATIEVSGARLVRAPQPAARGFRPDPEQLAAAISPRTRAIFYASPNNPTGVVLSEPELAGIAALARRHDLWIVADEVYGPLAPGGRVPGLARTLPGQVVTVASLSKSHAMTGWRAGWLIAPEEFVTRAAALSLAMLFGLPGFIQEAAITALAGTERAARQVREYCERGRALMLDGLREVPAIVPHAPAVGMFMLLDVRRTGLSGRAFTRALYEQERVAVVDGGAFGRETDGFVRVCFATGDAEIVAACIRIRRFCAATRAAVGA
jgi:octopine/nopaline transport system ATP-binding protein